MLTGGLEVSLSIDAFFNQNIKCSTFRRRYWDLSVEISASLNNTCRFGGNLIISLLHNQHPCKINVFGVSV